MLVSRKYRHASVAIMTTGRIEMGPTARTVADNIRRLREARGMSLRALSAELKKVGRNLSADALNKIENGRTLPPEAEAPKQIRRADVDDLMALAAVFKVNPSALLFPHTYEGTVELTGIGPVDAKTAWKWARGFRPLHVPEGDDGTAYVDFLRHAHPLGYRDFGRSEAGRRAFREDHGGRGFVQRRRDGTYFTHDQDGNVLDLEFDESGNLVERHDKGDE
ncbi:helix-turn-helix domain-containing protein [Streptomyces sp. TRM68367]|uniref:helix-turn-helix domain-containing protein n=1 Tax=Streptomyces sp. TRM68367 TaxID=2758415 RepID=UPI00165C2068|nr:helix-turn-helix transcriptional regulator [Streptomyces sp. TRM68367]MBC9729989.1 helix-turn-helix transcriptional regulator [Streptomyces sp. TRM68367]